MFTRASRLNRHLSSVVKANNSNLASKSQIITVAVRNFAKIRDTEERSEQLAAAVENEFQVYDEEDRYSKVLDPLNPPRLTYEHVKMIKNIDYSPIIKRAREGGMFTVADVMRIVEETGADDAFKAVQDPAHKQDPFVFEETFDVFNSGRKRCPLCVPDPTEERVNRVHYTNVNLLRRFISPTGMILPKRISGVCQVHQNKLRYHIKSARTLALISPLSNWQVPTSFVYPEQYTADVDQPAAHYLEAVERVNLVYQKKLAGLAVDGEVEDEQDLDKFIDDINHGINEAKDTEDIYHNNSGPL